MQKIEEEKREEVRKKKEENSINVRVVNQEGVEIYFKIKNETPMKKMMDAYCQRQGVDPQAVRFLYDGQRLQPEQTPKQLEMENNDIIDAVLQQVGGF